MAFYGAGTTSVENVRNRCVRSVPFGDLDRALITICVASSSRSTFAKSVRSPIFPRGSAALFLIKRCAKNGDAGPAVPAFPVFTAPRLPRYGWDPSIWAAYGYFRGGCLRMIDHSSMIMPMTNIAPANHASGLLSNCLRFSASMALCLLRAGSAFWLSSRPTDSKDPILPTAVRPCVTAIKTRTAICSSRLLFLEPN